MKTKIKKIAFVFFTIFGILLMNQIASSQEWGDPVDTTFSNVGFCNYDASSSSWVENIYGTIQDVNSRGDCYRNRTLTQYVNYEQTMCCPEGQDCIHNALEDTYTCGIADKNFCSDYNTQSTCEGDKPSWVANRDIENLFGEGFCSEVFFNSTTQCFEVRSCFCRWDSTDDKCEPKHTTSEKYCIGDSSGLHRLECEIKIKEKTPCEDGKMFVKWNASYFNESGNILTCTFNDHCQGYLSLGNPLTCQEGLCRNSDCVPGERVIDCPTEVLLRFISTWGILIAVILIVVFYILLRRKKQSKKKTSKKIKKKARKSKRK